MIGHNFNACAKHTLFLVDAVPLNTPDHFRPFTQDSQGAQLGRFGRTPAAFTILGL